MLLHPSHLREQPPATPVTIYTQRSKLSHLILDVCLVFDRSKEDLMDTMKFLSAVVFVIGIILFAGNTLGFLPTFPFAGFLTMFFGSVLWQMGNKWNSE
jgi:hypothetical protein